MSTMRTRTRTGTERFFICRTLKSGKAESGEIRSARYDRHEYGLDSRQVGDITIYFLYLKGEAVMLWDFIHLKKDYALPDKIGMELAFTP